MKLLLPVTLDEVVAVWLGAEVDSNRFGAIVCSMLRRDGLPAALVTDPDLTDEQANAARLGLLREYRGFDQADTSLETYSGGLPVRDLAWWRVSIDAADVARLHYINWDYWVAVTGGTRLAATFASAKLAEPDEADAFDTLRDAFVAGAPVPEIILVDSGPDTRVVILEGHVRATAMAMAGDDLKERTALLGRSEVVADQWFY
ncbi:hypothetical protein ABZ478_37490 [Streptomyces sp. NPDC005706]|uniref:hypothetical protein n=1 Tax=Streptomyces sp. NPDC005706 TaxID=3157169 RepID=UPI0033C03516